MSPRPQPIKKEVDDLPTAIDAEEALEAREALMQCLQELDIHKQSHRNVIRCLVYHVGNLESASQLEIMPEGTWAGIEFSDSESELED